MTYRRIRAVWAIVVALMAALWLPAYALCVAATPVRAGGSAAEAETSPQAPPIRKYRLLYAATAEPDKIERVVAFPLGGGPLRFVAPVLGEMAGLAEGRRLLEDDRFKAEDKLRTRSAQGTLVAFDVEHGTMPTGTFRLPLVAPGSSIRPTGPHNGPSVEAPRLTPYQGDARRDPTVRRCPESLSTVHTSYVRARVFENQAAEQHL